MHSDIRITIVNRNEIEGEGLRRILTDCQFNVGECCRSLATMTVMRRDSGTVPVIIVTSATDAASIELCRQVRAQWPWVKILLMAHSCSSKQVAAAFRGGGDGYVSKDISCASLVQAIKLVALGEKMVPSEIVTELAELQNDPWWTGSEEGIDKVNMSDREIEILQGLVYGEANKVISRRLGIREATVKVHVKSILRKLNVMNRTQAAIWALSRGITPEAEPAVLSPDAAGIALAEGIANGRVAPINRPRQAVERQAGCY